MKNVKLTNKEIAGKTPAELAQLGFKVFQVDLPKYPTKWTYFFISKTKRDISTLYDTDMKSLRPILREDIDLSKEKTLKGYFVADGESYESAKDLIQSLNEE